MSTTSRWVLFITEDNQQKLVLIHRIKNGKEYYVFPWGHIENWETPEQALIREIKEELSIDITVRKLLEEYKNTDLWRHEYFYLGEVSGWTLTSGNWPEWQENNPNNFYEIVKIPIHELTNYNLVPIEIKEVIIEQFL